MATHKTVDEVLEKASQVEFKFHGRDKIKKPGAYEKADPVPVAPPVGYRKREPHLWEQMRDAQRLAALEALEETEDDADDFIVQDDPDSLPNTPWENDRDPSLKDAKATSARLQRELEAAEALEEQKQSQEVGGDKNTPRPHKKGKEVPSSED